MDLSWFEKETGNHFFGIWSSPKGTYFKRPLCKYEVLMDSYQNRTEGIPGRKGKLIYFLGYKLLNYFRQANFMKLFCCRPNRFFLFNVCTSIFIKSGYKYLFIYTYLPLGSLTLLHWNRYLSVFGINFIDIFLHQSHLYLELLIVIPA